MHVYAFSTALMVYKTCCKWHYLTIDMHAQNLPYLDFRKHDATHHYIYCRRQWGAWTPRVLLLSNQLCNCHYLFNASETYTV